MIPVSSKRTCGPGPCIPGCTKDLFWKGGAKHVKGSVSSPESPQFKLFFLSLEIIDLRLGTKPSHEAREKARFIKDGLWLEMELSIKGDQTGNKILAFGGLYFSMATYATVAV